MRYTIFTDLHKFGPYDDDIQNVELNYWGNVVYLGDNFDVYCKKININKMKDAIHEHHKRCNFSNIINIRSNHEGRYSGHLPVSAKRNGVCFVHGHRQDYSIEKTLKWEKKSAGISKLRFYMYFWVNRILKYVEVVNIPYNKLVKYAKTKGCHTIVAGHFHRNTDKVVDGIRVITLDRGRHEVEL